MIGQRHLVLSRAQLDHNLKQRIRPNTTIAPLHSELWGPQQSNFIKTCQKLKFANSILHLAILATKRLVLGACLLRDLSLCSRLCLIGCGQELHTTLHLIGFSIVREVLVLVALLLSPHLGDDRTVVNVGTSFVEVSTIVDRF
jgi:hypothetical protein